jgi:hypothetical protein
LVLDTVTSTPQWIRQPMPRGIVFVSVRTNKGIIIIIKIEVLANTWPTTL